MFIATATQPVERVCQLSDRPTPAILLPSILSRAWTQEPASQPSGWRGRWWWRRFGMQSPWPQTSENHETLFGYTTHPVNCCRPTPSRRVISHRANDPPFISFRGMGAAYRHAIHPTRLWVCMQPQSYYPSSSECLWQGCVSSERRRRRTMFCLSRISTEVASVKECCINPQRHAGEWIACCCVKGDRE